MAFDDESNMSDTQTSKKIMAAGLKNHSEESGNRGFEEKKVLSMLRCRDSFGTAWPV